MDQVKIGKFIAQSRKEKGLTQSQLAKQLGVSDKSISRWENGKTIPDISLYEPLCLALNVHISELLYGKKMSNDEKANYGEKTALNLLTTKSQLESFAILTEILIIVGIIISFTITNLLSKNLFETFITLLCGWFVWGFGLLLRIKIKKAISKLDNN